MAMERREADTRVVPERPCDDASQGRLHGAGHPASRARARADGAVSLRCGSRLVDLARGLPRGAAAGRGAPFMFEAFRKRLCEGLDLGDDDVIADAAQRVGLGRDTILAAAHSDAPRAAASDGFRLGIERDGIFGVPSFVYAGKLYWGQDRMHFLRDAVARKSTRP